MSDLLVYAIGDSVMWGEGLNHEDKFAMRVARSLAAARGLTPTPVLRAHCGGTINATQEQRVRFADTFPKLFTEEQRNRFIFGPTPDESPTDLEHLHGEIPRAFPTIHYQLRNIPEDDAQRIDVLLINGGANDLDFERVFEIGGNFLEILDEEYQRIFHDDIMALLTAARQKCPRALIVLTGYYSAFSTESKYDAMKDLILELKNKADDYKLLQTIGAVSFNFGLFFVPTLLEEIFGAEERLEKAISLARATSEAGESRAHYWMRRAVTEINEDPGLAAVRGPGLAFASPGFLPEDCMFAQHSLIWQKYTTDTLDDDAQAVRAELCPRNALRDDMGRFLDRLIIRNNPPPSTGEVLDLHTKLDGPTTLRDELEKLARQPANTNLWDSVAALLAAEIARIDITRISSLFHPNRKGAERYSAVVHKRAEQLRLPTSVRERLRHFLGPSERSTGGPEALSLGQTIRRFGFGLKQAAIGVKACLAHAEPDVLGLDVKTHLTSDLIPREVFLNLGAGMRWNLRLLLKESLGSLKVNPHLRPGKTDFFTIDVAGRISLGDITQAVIEFEEELTGEEWMPEAITLSIDGREVLSRKYPTEPGKELPRVTHTLDMGFPG